MTINRIRDIRARIYYNDSGTVSAQLMNSTGTLMLGDAAHVPACTSIDQALASLAHQLARQDAAKAARAARNAD